MNKLSENWSANGNDIIGFFTELSGLERRTKVETVNLQDTRWLSIPTQSVKDAMGIEDQGDDTYTVFTLDRKNPGNSTPMSLSKNSVIKLSLTPAAQHELEADIETIGGVLAFAPEDGTTQIVPMSTQGFKDLCDRAGVACTRMGMRSLQRDRWLAENLTNAKSSIVMREVSDQKKIFAVRGQIYQYRPQSELIKQVTNVLNNELGSAQCVEWKISNDKTEILLAYPDKQEEIQDAYPELKDICPIVKIETSDLGLSAFWVSAGFQVGNGKLFTKHGSASMIHDSKLNSERMEKKIRKNCFPELLSVPQELARLLSIEIHNMPLAIDELMNYLKLDKIVGLKAAAEALKETLLGELAFGSYTAYDLVSAAISAPDHLVLTKKTDGEEKILSAQSMQKMRDAISEAIYCPFDSIDELEGTLL